MKAFLWICEIKLIVLLHPLKELQNQLNAWNVKVECAEYSEDTCIWLDFNRGRDSSSFNQNSKSKVVWSFLPQMAILYFLLLWFVFPFFFLLSFLVTLLQLLWVFCVGESSFEWLVGPVSNKSLLVIESPLTFAIQKCFSCLGTSEVGGRACSDSHGSSAKS